MAQWYAQVSGQQYGPVSEEEMRNWVVQGRVSTADLVWGEGMPNWVPASTVFAGSTPSISPPAYSPATATSYTMPHRGTTILVLGILGLVVNCGILGIIAWVMGNNDLRLMASGQMDRAGESTTKAGKICGMVSAIIMFILGGVILIGMLLSLARNV